VVDREALRQERLVKNEQAARAYKQPPLRFELDDDSVDGRPTTFPIPVRVRVTRPARGDGDDPGRVHGRSTPHRNRFAVLPRHVLGEVEWVVEDGDKFWVVEKRPSAMSAV
jgi:hypothetical protein